MIRLTDFTGLWHITRTIEDARGPDIRFDGTATFTPDGHGLTLTEEGRMHIAGQSAGQTSLHATRRYLWRESPNGIEVLFDDTRPFHRFTPTQDAPQATHWCDPDTYEVTYTFPQDREGPQDPNGWPTLWPNLWQTTWRVKGPRKDYLMRSEYRR